MGKYSRVKVWGTEVLLSTDLNGEFDAVRSSVNSVAEEQLVDGAVSTVKIANGAVTTSQIGARAVTSDRIAVGNVIAESIGTHVLTRTKFTDNEVLWQKLHKSVVTQTFTPQNAGTADVVVATIAHGLQDEAGVKRAPTIVLCRWKKHSSSRWNFASDDGAITDSWDQRDQAGYDPSGQLIAGGYKKVNWGFYAVIDDTNVVIHKYYKDVGTLGFAGEAATVSIDVEFNLL